MSNSPTKSLQKWIEDVIIKYKFCPFAKAEVIANRIRYLECPKQNLQKATESIIEECFYLNHHPASETSLLIFDDEYKDFFHFLALIESVDDILDRVELREAFQIAHFHPNYLFDGEPQNSPTHYTNRAPYPTIHIIRQASIERVMKGREDSQDIVERNLFKCHELGLETLRNALHSASQD